MTNHKQRFQEDLLRSVSILRIQRDLLVLHSKAPVEVQLMVCERALIQPVQFRIQKSRKTAVHHELFFYAYPFTIQFDEFAIASRF